MVTVKLFGTLRLEAGVKELQPSYKDISDISDLKWFPNLEEFWAPGNQISDKKKEKTVKQTFHAKVSLSATASFVTESEKNLLAECFL